MVLKMTCWLTVLVVVVSGLQPSAAFAHPYSTAAHGGAIYPSFFGQYISNTLGARITYYLPDLPVSGACMDESEFYMPGDPCGSSDANVLPVQVGIVYPTTPNPDFHAAGIYLGCGVQCSGVQADGRGYKRLYVDGRCNGVYYFMNLSQTFSTGSTVQVEIRRTSASVWKPYVNGTYAGAGANTCGNGQLGLASYGHELTHFYDPPDITTAMTLHNAHFAYSLYRRDQYNAEYSVTEAQNSSPHGQQCGVSLAQTGYGPILTDYGAC